MIVYVVSNGEIETGKFHSKRGDTIQYVSNGIIKMEHIRNVFFKKRNAQRYNLQMHGVFRPVLNGTSHSQETS